MSKEALVLFEKLNQDSKIDLEVMDHVRANDLSPLVSVSDGLLKLVPKESSTIRKLPEARPPRGHRIYFDNS